MGSENQLKREQRIAEMSAEERLLHFGKIAREPVQEKMCQECGKSCDVFCREAKLMWFRCCNCLMTYSAELN